MIELGYVSFPGRDISDESGDLVLPPPPAWMDQSACGGLPTAWWFPGRHDSAARETREAYEVCNRCPVKDQCLEEALNSTRRDDFGIRGGTSERQRRGMRGQRSRAARNLLAVAS